MAWKTPIQLPEKAKAVSIETLQGVLSDVLDLWSHAKAAHWNVKGPSFIALHQLFDEVAGHLDEAADMIAERIVQLGGMPEGTARQVAKASRLKEFPTTQDEKQTVKALAERMSAFADTVRDAIDTVDEAGDANTADLFTEVSRQLEKDLWFVAAHLA